jgi:hypothetical protein
MLSAAAEKKPNQRWCTQKTKGSGKVDSEATKQKDLDSCFHLPFPVCWVLFMAEFLDSSVMAGALQSSLWWWPSSEAAKYVGMHLLRVKHFLPSSLELMFCSKVWSLAQSSTNHKQRDSYCGSRHLSHHSMATERCSLPQSTWPLITEQNEKKPEYKSENLPLPWTKKDK